MTPEHDSPRRTSEPTTARTSPPTLPPSLLLYQLATGHYLSRALFVVAKLGVADQL